MFPDDDETISSSDFPMFGRYVQAIGDRAVPLQMLDESPDEEDRDDAISGSA